MTTLCASCGQRRGKRACPALGQEICPVCCGTKRQVEIQCPPTCAYLSAARTHPAAAVVRRREQDLQFVLPLVRDLTTPQHNLLVLFQSIVLKESNGALPPLRDEDVAEGARASAATLETAGKGIIYEHHADSIPARHLAAEFARLVAEMTGQPGIPPSFERDAAIALRRLEQGARTAAAALPGDPPPVYLSLLSRILSHRAADAALEETPATEPRLILP